jgi:very-short-patch-repair endonuclease
MRRQTTKESIERRLVRLAERQHGLVTRQQALTTGMSERSLDRRVASARLHVIHPGVYRFPGTVRSWQQDVLAACLYTHGVASHRSAAALWSLSGFERTTLEVTTLRRVRPRQIVVHRNQLAGSDVTRMGVVPVTSINRTLLDLGAVVTRTCVEAALTEALRQRLTTVDSLQVYLEHTQGQGRRGTGHLRRAIELLGGQPAESVLELKLVRLLRRHRLPEPARQFSVHREGRVLARLDFAYPEIKLAIETDGYRHHGDVAAWGRDLARRNALTASGWQLIHVTWTDVERRPGLVVEQITTALRRLRGDQLSLVPDRR